MSMKVRDGWRRMFARLQNSPYNGKLSDLAKVFGIGKNIAPTLYQMGVIQQTPEGWMIPKDRRQTAAMWDRVRMLHPHTKEEQDRILASGIISPSPASVAEKKTALEEEMNRGLHGWVEVVAPTTQQIKSDWEKQGISVRISDTAATAPTLAEAIEIVTAAGGTVVFWDKK